jgi:hypothetical protein
VQNVGWKLVEGFPYKNGQNSRAALLTGSNRAQTVDESLRARTLIGSLYRLGAKEDSGEVARRCGEAARRCGLSVRRY